MLFVETPGEKLEGVLKVAGGVEHLCLGNQSLWVLAILTRSYSLVNPTKPKPKLVPNMHSLKANQYNSPLRLFCLGNQSLWVLAILFVAII